MALQAFLIKKPYQISFTGNPMPYSFALTPYGSVEQNQDIRFIARILVEESFGSNNFIEVKSQVFYPDDKGQVNFDVKKIIHPYLEYYMPNADLLKPMQATNQRKRYRVDYLIQKDGALLGSVEATPILFAIKGGMAYDQWHPKEFFTELISTKKQSLQFHPQRKIAFDELRYFFWLYPAADNAVQSVLIDILLDDQTTIQHTLADNISTGQWAVCCVPIGFNQLKLNALVPAGATAISYTVQVKVPGAAVVAPVTFVLEQRNFYNTTQLFYRTSTGGIETICMRGQIDFEADYARQAVQNTVPPAYFSNMVLLSQQNDINASEVPKFKGDTGFLTQEASDRMRDFFLSDQKFEIVPGDDDNKPKLLPITVITKNTKFFSNRDNLISTLIEWQRGYANEWYTPKRSMPTVRACPALEFFNVTQINKSLLQIMYALEAPYDRVEIKIITSLGTQIFYFTGNSRTIRQPFTNPVAGTTGDEDIVIEARTVCNEFSTPMDLGPASIVNLNVVGNTLPIANDDTYNIAVGFNTGVVLPVSVLFNDYDPDNDPIECIVQTAAATHDGGVVSLTAAGVVTYTPPSSVYTGQDYFDYEIREVGGLVTVTARVYINVGSFAAGVYAKIVYRNVYNSQFFYITQISGEVWVDFFADASGTIPLDVTSLALSVNVNEHLFEQDFAGTVNNTDTTIVVAATGTKVKVFEDMFFNENADPVYAFAQVMSLVHTLLPGTGYTVI